MQRRASVRQDPSSISSAAEPMKPATNLVARRRKTSGVPHCSICPSRMNDDAVGERHRLHLIMGDVDHASPACGRASFLISVRTWVLSFASRFDKGSSKERRSGCRTIARPLGDALRWRPTVAKGDVEKMAEIEDRRRLGNARLDLFGRTPAIFSEKPIFSATVICGRVHRTERPSRCCAPEGQIVDRFARRSRSRRR